jgi:PAS domain S-box-containing protein
MNMIETDLNGRTGAPIRVLLVDDDEDAYILTRHHLSKIQHGGVKLDWAPSYETGLEKIRENAHDVFLFDYRLGARTGLDLLQEAISIGCKEPIIMLTTENPIVDAEAMQLGAADFLNKDKLDTALLERSIRYSIKHFRTLRALRESEARLASFLQYVPCAISMKNKQGQYVFANETYAHLFQRKVEDWIGKTDAQLWPKGAAQKFQKLDQRVIAENRPIETTESVQREDGTHYWLSTKFPMLNEQGEVTMLGTAAIDITESKRLEREIQQISEQEKRRIGRDLHDGLGQYLTGIACMVKVLEQKLAAKEAAEAADARKITAMVNETISQTRDLARGLCPVELERNGLQAALQELAANMEKLSKVPCKFKTPQFVSVYDNSSAVHLYRIAQEALNNAVKHGKATEVTMSLSTNNGQITLVIEDNGIGIPENADKVKGMGLRVMNHRAAIIGATVTIESRPQAGTTVTCVFENKSPNKKPSKSGTARSNGGVPRTSPEPVPFP